MNKPRAAAPPLKYGIPVYMSCQVMLSSYFAKDEQNEKLVPFYLKTPLLFLTCFYFLQCLWSIYAFLNILDNFMSRHSRPSGIQSIRKLYVHSELFYEEPFYTDILLICSRSSAISARMILVLVDCSILILFTLNSLPGENVIRNENPKGLYSTTCRIYDMYIYDCITQEGKKQSGSFSYHMFIQLIRVIIIFIHQKRTELE